MFSHDRPISISKTLSNYIRSLEQKTTERSLLKFSSQKDRGASMVEFAIFVPILVLLFIGLVEMGRLLSEYTWVAQASYQTALLGSETLPSLGQPVMEKRKQDLYQIQGKHLQSSLVMPTPSYQTGASDRYVQIQMQGEMTRLLKSSYNMDLSVSSTAPLLLLNLTPPSDLNTFSNDVCSYDCAGVKCCGVGCAPSPLSCGFAPKPNDPGDAVTGGSGGCFLPDTPITMDSGESRNIVDLKPGDKIKSFNLKTGKLETGTVTKFFVHDAKNYLIINDHIKITPNHPVYFKKKWVPVGSLKVGDELTTSTGAKEKISSIKLVEESVKVYNVEAQPLHNYIASGVLVHNKGSGGGCFAPNTPITMDSGEAKNIIEVKVGDKIKSVDLKSGKLVTGSVTKFFVHDVSSYIIVNDRIKITPNHPVYFNKKWVPVGSLKLGDELTTGTGSKEKITSLKLVEEPLKVYNLEVEPHHNYLASGILVHNKILAIPEF